MAETKKKEHSCRHDTIVRVLSSLYLSSSQTPDGLSPPRSWTKRSITYGAPARGISLFYYLSFDMCSACDESTSPTGDKMRNKWIRTFTCVCRGRKVLPRATGNRYNSWRHSLFEMGPTLQDEYTKKCLEPGRFIKTQCALQVRVNSPGNVPVDRHSLGVPRPDNILFNVSRDLTSVGIGGFGAWAPRLASTLDTESAVNAQRHACD